MTAALLSLLKDFLGGRKGVSQNSVCFTELNQESPSNEMLDKGLSTIAGICLTSDLELYFTYQVMWFYPT